MRRVVKYLIQSAFNQLGYEIHRKPLSSNVADNIFRLRASMREGLYHLRKLGFEPMTVIDVGVAFGTPELYETFPSAKHLLVEPLVEYEPVMQRICGQYDAEYVLAAAGAENSIMRLGVSQEPEASSLLTADIEASTRVVQVVRLDDLCAERRLPAPYLIKVDVQGAELLVLDGATTILQETEAIILEVSLFSFFGVPEFAEVIAYMRERGFVAYDLFGGCNRPFDNARAQVDILFVKENGIFRESRAWAS